MKKDEIPLSYTILWAIVSATSIIIVVFGIFGMGAGRWECVEYTEENCYVVCNEWVKTTRYEGRCNEIYPVKCSGDMEGGTIKSECIKEVWIREVN